jgi:hypothetical protein
MSEFDEFHRPTRRGVMGEREQAARETWAPGYDPLAAPADEAPARRPSFSLPAGAVQLAPFALLALVAIIGLALAMAARGDRVPLAQPQPTVGASESAPAPPVENERPFVSVAPTASQEQPTAAPVPTLEGGYLEPVGQPQAAPAGPAPQPAYSAPAAPAAPADLVPIQPTAPIDCANRGIGPCRGSRP